jgi:2-oxoglutarate ferredoxin oxidoreductase subunit alpha
MAWGAAATGTPAATGSTGQGLALMQESFAELSYGRVPLVLLNMARAQGDYFQATRGGGHGDYRHVVLAPADANEAVELVQLAFHLAFTWRNPVLVFGDYYLAHTMQSVTIEQYDFGPLPPADWALDGTSGGTGKAKLLSSLSQTKRRDMAGYDLGQVYVDHAQRIAEMLAAIEPRAESGHTDDADVVVVAFGTPGRYVRAAVESLRAEGERVGYVRPITLLPFPEDAIRQAAAGAQCVAVYENNTGQMYDDVRLALLGSVPTEFIGGPSYDESGFGIAPDLDVNKMKDRIRGVLGRVRSEKATV